MSMALFVYVDNSNVWIEGMRVAAVNRGLAPDIQTAMLNGIQDAWAYDFGRLYDVACPAGEAIGRSALFGSRPPPNDSLWNRARDNGFQVFVHDRNVAGKEKKVDNHINTVMIEDSYEFMQTGRDKAVLVAGDGDFVPPVLSLRRRGLEVRVIFWSHASRELRQSASEFLDLDQHFDYITR